MHSIGICIITAFFILIGCQDNPPVLGPYPTQGLASWYAVENKSGKDALICAMRKLDFGKYYRVCNAKSAKCVIVRHNDFGPSKKMYLRGRIIDLSREAFSQIAELQDGVIQVTVNEKTD